MDTMMRFDNDQLNEFLTKEEVKRRCPVAFIESPTNPNLSTKYVQANTETVIDDLEKLGWRPVEAKQKKTRAGSIYSFHMIAFQNPEVKVVKVNDDGTKEVDAYPRIILTNSHDGFNSFKFMMGVFRLVCSNGLVVCTDKMVDMSIRHINYTFEELRKVVSTSIQEIPNVVAQMNEMREVVLTDNEKKELAKEVIRIRKNIKEDAEFQVSDDDLKEVLEPIRKEDAGNDLWSVFNVCQEKMIKGGFLSTNKNNRKRKVRGISSIVADMDYNKKLWLKASRYLVRS